MQTRPKIKLELSPLDNNLEAIAKVFVVLIWCMAMYSFFTLPETIPVHFNAAGKADGYGSKVMLFILPVLATGLYFGLTLLNKYPHIFNYITTITEDNARRQYTIATRTLRYLKLAVLLIFSLIILFTYLEATGMINGLGSWFIPVTSVLLLLPIALAIIKSLKKTDKPA